MLVISQPILTSAGEGPVRGALIMGSFLDKSESDALAQAVGLPLEIFAYRRFSDASGFSDSKQESITQRTSLYSSHKPN